MHDYYRIASALKFIKDHSLDQPNLDTIAKHVNLSPFHFQKLFTEWAGVSPKKFLQYLTVENAKAILLKNGGSVYDAAYESGLSGTGRLHDLLLTSKP